MISGMANGSLPVRSARARIGDTSDKNDKYVLGFLAKESFRGGELKVDEQSWIVSFQISNKTKVHDSGFSTAPEAVMAAN
jgi:hypothetical protein